jgi:hypothetical protein
MSTRSITRQLTRSIQRGLDYPKFGGRPYLNFNASSIVATASTTLATDETFELEAKINIPSFSSASAIFAVDENPGLLIRLTVTAGAIVRFLVSGGSNIDVDDAIVVDTNYKIVVTGTGGGAAIVIVVTDLDTGLVHTTSGAPEATADAAQTGQIVIGSTSVLGAIINKGRVWDVKYSEAGILQHHWPIDEGAGTVINDIEGGLDGVLTLNSGIWETGAIL